MLLPGSIRSEWWGHHFYTTSLPALAGHWLGSRRGCHPSRRRDGWPGPSLDWAPPPLWAGPRCPGCPQCSPPCTGTPPRPPPSRCWWWGCHCPSWRISSPAGPTQSPCRPWARWELAGGDRWPSTPASPQSPPGRSDLAGSAGTRGAPGQPSPPAPSGGGRLSWRWARQPCRSSCRGQGCSRSGSPARQRAEPSSGGPAGGAESSWATSPPRHRPGTGTRRSGSGRWSDCGAPPETQGFLGEKVL